MHKGIIFLIKNDNADTELLELQNALNKRLKHIIGEYVIGGRWTGELSMKNDNFRKIAEKELLKRQKNMEKKNPEKEETPIYMVGVELKESTVKIKENAIWLQEKWEKMGGLDKNPYERDKYTPNGYQDDILPLSDCIDVVKGWSFDSVEAGQYTLKEAQECLKKSGDKPDYSTYGYLLKQAGSFFCQSFSTDINVYNLESFDYDIPENLEGWYAVMVDMCC